MSGGGAEREGDTESQAGSTFWAVSPEPDVGLELTNREIMTWAGDGCSTKWATQALQKQHFEYALPWEKRTWPSKTLQDLPIFKCRGLNQIGTIMLTPAWQRSGEEWEMCLFFFLLILNTIYCQIGFHTTPSGHPNRCPPQCLFLKRPGHSPGLRKVC